MSMKPKASQGADPGTATGTPAGGAPLNSVDTAPGADRLDFIKTLITPDPEEEAEANAQGQDSDEEESHTATPAEPADSDANQADEPGEDDQADEETNEDAEESEEEAETDQEDQADHGRIPGLKPEVQRAIDKRIGKEVAKRKAAEARIAALEARLQEAGRPAAAAKAEPAGADPIATVNTEDELDNVLSQARQARDYVRDATDRLLDEPEAVIAELREAGVKLAADAEPATVRSQLRAIRRSAEAVLDREASARKRIALRAGYAQQVARDFAWSKDQTSEEFALYRNVLAHPAVQSRQDAEFLAAIVVEGLQSYKARTAQKPGKPAPKKVTRVPAQPGAPASAKVRPVNGAEDESVQQAWQRDPSDKSARQALLQRMLG